MLYNTFQYLSNLLLKYSDSDPIDLLPDQNDSFNIKYNHLASPFFKSHSKRIALNKRHQPKPPHKASGAARFERQYYIGSHKKGLRVTHPRAQATCVYNLRHRPYLFSTLEDNTTTQKKHKTHPKSATTTILYCDTLSQLSRSVELGIGGVASTI